MWESTRKACLSLFRGYRLPKILVAAKYITRFGLYLVTSGAEVTLAPSQLCRLEMWVEYARCHGSRSRYPLRIVFLDDNEMMWQWKKAWDVTPASGRGVIVLRWTEMKKCVLNAVWRLKATPIEFASKVDCVLGLLRTWLLKHAVGELIYSVHGYGWFIHSYHLKGGSSFLHHCWLNLNNENDL